MQGKTAAEAAEITDQLYKQVVASQSLAQTPLHFGGNSPLYAQPVSQQQPPQAPSAQDPFAAFAPELQQRDEMLGGQARALAALQYPDDFRRWGPDIDQALAQIAPAQRTPQVVDWIVAGVRGRHINELTDEFAKRRIDELVQGGTLRPQTAGEGAGEFTSNRVDFDKLPPRYASVLKNLGVTASDIDNMLPKVYPDLPLAKAREKWVAAASKGDVITDGTGKFHYDGDS